MYFWRLEWFCVKYRNKSLCIIKIFCFFYSNVPDWWKFYALIVGGSILKWICDVDTSENVIVSLAHVRRIMFNVKKLQADRKWREERNDINCCHLVISFFKYAFLKMLFFARNCKEILPPPLTLNKSNVIENVSRPKQFLQRLARYFASRKGNISKLVAALDGRDRLIRNRG